MKQVKLIGLYKNVIKDLVISFYARGAQDAGMTEEKALGMFISNYLMDEVDDSDEVLEMYMRLKKLLYANKQVRP